MGFPFLFSVVLLLIGIILNMCSHRMLRIISCVYTENEPLNPYIFIAIHFFTFMIIVCTIAKIVYYHGVSTLCYVLRRHFMIQGVVYFVRFLFVCMNNNHYYCHPLHIKPAFPWITGFVFSVLMFDSYPFVVYFSGHAVVLCACTFIWICYTRNYLIKLALIPFVTCTYILMMASRDIHMNQILLGWCIYGILWIGYHYSITLLRQQLYKRIRDHNDFQVFTETYIDDHIGISQTSIFKPEVFKREIQRIASLSTEPNRESTPAYKPWIFHIVLDGTCRFFIWFESWHESVKRLQSIFVGRHVMNA
jgi:hypothetical protein